MKKTKNEHRDFPSGASKQQMNERKDNWMNEVLGSLDGVERAEADPFLFEKISNRLSIQKQEKQIASRNPVWKMALAFLLILLLNLFTIKSILLPKNERGEKPDVYYQLNTGYNY
jgi:hypothetical protein